MYWSCYKHLKTERIVFSLIPFVKLNQYFDFMNKYFLMLLQGANGEELSHVCIIIIGIIQLTCHQIE